MEGDLKKIGSLGVALLGILIVIGIFFLVSGMWNENLCTQADSDYVWSGGECQASATNTTAITLDSITYVNVGVAAFVTALGFLGIVVLVGIAQILLKMVKGF